MQTLTTWLLGLPAYLMCLVPGLIVVAEPALLPGVVLPSVGSMVTLGFLAHLGAVSVPAAVLTGVAAPVVGDSTAYLLGRRWARRRDRLRGSIGAARWDRAERLTLRYGGLAVVAARFLTGLRTLVPRVGALSGMSYRRFLAHSLPAGLVWGTAFVLTGYLAGGSYLRVADLLGTAGLIVLAVLLVAAAVALAAWRLRNRPAPDEPARADDTADRS